LKGMPRDDETSLAHFDNTKNDMLCGAAHMVPSKACKGSGLLAGV